MSTTKRLFETLVSNAVELAKSNKKRHHRLSPERAVADAVLADPEARKNPHAWIDRLLPEVVKGINDDMLNRGR